MAYSRSKTIRFNMIMTAIEIVHGSLHMIQPFMEPMTFASVSIILGVVHGVGGIYLRSITDKPLSAYDE